MPEQAMSEPVSATFFDEHPALYDALIDWDKRLDHEGPFYRKVFKEIGVNSVLDAACGTGHHAAMFHSWGMQVEGADVSPRMIAHCRAAFGESESLHWVVRSFDRPCKPAGRFGAAVCVGNSLALAQDLETVHRALKALLSSVQSGGVLVIQVPNLWHVPEGETIWQKCRRVTLDGKDHILLKGLHRVGPRGFVDLVDLELVGDGVERRCASATFLGLEAVDLMGAARTAGATKIDAYGSYTEEPYNREESPDIILVCRRS